VSGYLLDTDILSEARKGQRANAAVLAWFDRVQDEELFLSVLVLGEIRKGIEQARPRDPSKAQALEAWLQGVEETYSDKIFPITYKIAARWGSLSALRPISVIDGLLAATALTHDLMFVTRNAQDVSHTGVKLLNPFDS